MKTYKIKNKVFGNLYIGILQKTLSLNEEMILQVLDSKIERELFKLRSENKINLKIIHK